MATTSLLLHFNGSTLVDEAGHTLTATGGAALSSAQKKFGDKSLQCSSSGDYISTPGGAHLDASPSEPYLLELFVYRSTQTAYGEVLDFGSSHVRLYVDNAGRLTLIYKGAMVFQGPATFEGDTRGCIFANTWHHIAIEQDASYFCLFIDEHLLYNRAAATLTSASTVYIGGAPSGIGALNGYMDEVRVAKGLTPYTISATPPVYNAYTTPTAEFVAEKLGLANSIGPTAILGTPEYYHPAIPVSIAGGTSLPAPVSSYDQFCVTQDDSEATGFGQPSASLVFTPALITAWPNNPVAPATLGTPALKLAHLAASIAGAVIGVPSGSSGKRTGEAQSITPSASLGQPLSSKHLVGLVASISGTGAAAPSAKYLQTGVPAQRVSTTVIGRPNLLPAQIAHDGYSLFVTRKEANVFTRGNA